MNLSKIFRKPWFLLFFISALMPVVARSASGDGYFDAPSGDNYMNYQISNVGGTTLDGLEIKRIEIVKEGDAAHILLHPENLKDAVEEPAGPFDVEVGEKADFRLGPFQFGEIEDKQKCLAFKNPELLV
jgi:hypothetical protein